jgi:hypothetical protein
MKSTSKIDAIKKLLGMEVAFAKQKLEDGTQIEAEAFEADNEVFIVSEEGEKVALPVGEYKYDGKVLRVEKEGVIASVSDEVKEEEVEESVEVEAEADVKSDTDALLEMIAELSSRIKALEGNTEMSAEVVAEEVKAESTEVEEVKMSEEVQPLTHSPEKLVKKEVEKVNFKKMTIAERVQSMINNN